VVATWNPAAASSYYTRRRETDYYVDNQEPEGIWYAPAGDLGLVDNATVDRLAFERLYAAVDGDGRSLLKKLRKHAGRVPAFDVTLSAPRSVSLAWAFAPPDVRAQIEAAQQRAVRATLAMLEREATWARRGRDGAEIEHVPLTAATFQQGESRVAKHSDGAVFADMNLHTHCVCYNLSTRRDGSIGALHSKVLRDFKMAAGATYHAALAFELENNLGFKIDRAGKNGVFELAGVDGETIRYFSARRKEIESELAKHGLTSEEAVPLAAAITKATRSSKRPHTRKREEVWAEAAQSLGLDVGTFTTRLRNHDRSFNAEDAEGKLAERLAALPRALTEHESVIDRRELVRAVAAALVGTGLPIKRAEPELNRLLVEGTITRIGQDEHGLPRYSTPEMIRIEREVVGFAGNLARRSWPAPDPQEVDLRCRKAKLSEEQIAAVHAATDGSAIAIIEGAPGAGKTTTLVPIVDCYLTQGCNVIGTATSWRIATMLRDDLQIESRATASWIARIKSGQRVIDGRTVLIADEAGLLSSREMHVLLGAVAGAGAKLILVGSRQQIQPIGAGPGLDLVARAVEATRLETIVRQKEKWTREAIMAFGSGRANEALEAFAKRGFLVEADGGPAALKAVIEQAERARSMAPDGSLIILAKSNTAVAAISREMRERLKVQRQITGPEVSFMAATPSGQNLDLALARGDSIKFLTRNDALGVINGTTGTVLKVHKSRGDRVTIDADVNGRRIRFDPMVLADSEGRPRIGWAYAATVAGAQGMTVDRAVVLLDPSFTRHDCLVAASRARESTTLIVDVKAIDRRLDAEMPLDRQDDEHTFSEQQRRTWLAERLSRAAPKISTWDVADFSQTAIAPSRDRSQRSRTPALDR